MSYPRPRQFAPLSLNEATLTAYSTQANGAPGDVVFLGAEASRVQLAADAQEVLWAASGDTSQTAHHVAATYLITCERTGVLQAADGRPALLVPNAQMILDVRWSLKGPGTKVWTYGLRYRGVTWRSDEQGSEGFHAFGQHQVFRARSVEELTA